MKFFTFSELIQSNTARILGIKNKPNQKQSDNLVEMVNNLLDPARQAYGHPLLVSSGFRCPELNKAVGGSKTSVHMIGFAVDLYSRNDNAVDLFNWFKEYLLDNNIKFDQLILETSSKSQWVHLGYKNNQGNQRCQIKEMVV